MAAAPEEKSAFPMYKNKPLVRCGDVLYYGYAGDSYIVRLQIKSKQAKNNMEVADKVVVQLLNTADNIDSKKAIVKSSEKDNLFLAVDIGYVWLQKALKESGNQ